MPDGTEGQEAEGTEGTAGDSSQASAGETDADKLKRENADLRGQLRLEHAKVLGAQFKLDTPTVELLASVDRDKQEERAKAIAAARDSGQPSERAGASEMVSEPADAAGMAAMQASGNASPSTDKPKNEALIDRIKATTSTLGLEEIVDSEQQAVVARTRALLQEG